MKMVLLGPPGSDKGEYAIKLAKKYQVVLLTVTGVLSDAADRRLEAGIQARVYFEHGQYVPDEILLEVIRERLSRPDVKAGFLLVGFPRSAVQATSLDEMLEESGMSLDLAFHLDVDDEVLLERLEGRRTCISCGSKYNVFSNPPMVHGVCDNCGGKVGRGVDSNEVVISNRLRAYDQQIHSLASYYLSQEKLREIPSNGSPKEVIGLLYKAIDAWLSGDLDEHTKALMEKVEAAVELATPKPEDIPVEVESDETAAVVTEKKASAKKVPVKKVPVKKVPVKKVPAKKVPAKKAPVKKAPVKKVPVKKAPVKKVPAKKVPAKKVPAKKVPAKKVPAKKVPVKKVPVKKAPVKKVPVKKVPVKKVPVKKVPVKKVPVKKVPVKKAPVKKVPVKKVPAKKVPVKKSGKKK